MAGGIDWFRWHHGSVTDPKFQLIARKSGASLPDVLAVWAYVLEQASAHETRGNHGEIDCEAVDCMFGFDDGQTKAILNAMHARAMLADGRVTSWDKRQPKRERDTDSSAERTRAYRERQKKQGDAEKNNVTPCDAIEHQKNARGEESREEISPSLRSGDRAPRKRDTPQPIAKPDDVDQQTWDDWQALRKAKRAPVTQTVVGSAREEAEKAGLSLDAFLRVWCRRGSQGLEAAWLKPEERASPAATGRHSGFGSMNYREGVSADGSLV